MAAGGFLDLLLLGNVARFSLAHNGVLAAHPPAEGAIELGSEGQLIEVGALFLGKSDPLLCKSLIFHAIEAILDVLDLVRSAHGGRGDRGSHAVCTVPNRGAGLFGVGRARSKKLLVSHGSSC